MSTGAGHRRSACRGRLRIYLGYAPGVGTTSALLSEGRLRAEHGTDVVVAHAETHDRRHTQALLEGLEVIPPATVPRHGTTVEQADLGALLARNPQVALVDDLGLLNVPGARHHWRWQDAAALAAAGIEVISTVSTGHLDSLADVVSKITGAAARYSVPDSFVRMADEVEMVDLTPEALRDRMARGQIYSPPEADAALRDWFQTPNLSALREQALLWLAAKLAGDRRRYGRGGQDPGEGNARERVVVALSGGSEGELLIRRAARITSRCGGDLVAVHTARPGGRGDRSCAVLTAQRQLVESLGGTYQQLADEDIPAALLTFAHAVDATRLMLGASRRRWPAALRPATTIAARVIRQGGGIGVHVVPRTRG